MLAAKEEIRIEQAIVHILDSSLGVPVLSDTVLDCGSDFSDFLKAHIFKVDSSDEVRNCTFQKNPRFFIWRRSGIQRSLLRLPRK